MQQCGDMLKRGIASVLRWEEVLLPFAICLPIGHKSYRVWGCDHHFMSSHLLHTNIYMVWFHFAKLLSWMWKKKSTWTLRRINCQIFEASLWTCHCSLRVQFPGRMIKGKLRWRWVLVNGLRVWRGFYWVSAWCHPIHHHLRCAWENVRRCQNFYTIPEFRFSSCWWSCKVLQTRMPRDFRREIYSIIIQGLEIDESSWNLRKRHYRNEKIFK